MNACDAIKDAKELNKSGEHREDWFYYPAWHDTENEWFVMRRLKTKTVQVATFVNGKRSCRENGGR